MWGLPTPMIVTFLAFSGFHFYMSRHAGDYRGTSRGFGQFLTVYTFAGLLFQVGFWIYFGFSLGWGAALKLGLIVFVLMGVVIFPVETWITARLTKRGTDWNPATDLPAWLSMLGIPALPILAYFMLQLAARPLPETSPRAFQSG